MTAQDFWALSPEIAMAVLALVVISVDLVTRSMAKVSVVAFIGLAAPVTLTLNLWFGWFGDPASGQALFDTFEADQFSLFFKFLLLTVTAGTILASANYIARDRMKDYGGEFVSLVLLSVTGMMILVSATELITIYVALELTALPVVALAAIHRTKQGVEAGTKFFVLSAMAFHRGTTAARMAKKLKLRPPRTGSLDDDDDTHLADCSEGFQTAAEDSPTKLMRDMSRVTSWGIFA